MDDIVRLYKSNELLEQLHYIKVEVKTMSKHSRHFANTVTIWKLWKRRQE